MNDGRPGGARSCDQSCSRPTTAQAHCATCHRTFGGVGGFDWHRRSGACVDPLALGLVDVRGVWRRQDAFRTTADVVRAGDGADE